MGRCSPLALRAPQECTVNTKAIKDARRSVSSRALIDLSDQIYQLSAWTNPKGIRTPPRDFALLSVTIQKEL
jgi:hypothetical protein